MTEAKKTFGINDVVLVREPFNEAFPNPLTVTDVINNDDGQTVYILGDAGAFDAIYLELA